MNASQDKWNARWRDKAVAADWRPDPWLQRFHPQLPMGSVLDVASGMGRNALFLVEQGYEATAVDFSPVALEQLSLEAGRRGVAVTTLLLDLEKTPLLPKGPFDVLLNFFYLHRPLLAQELSRVRPGGVVLMRTFSRAGADRFGAVRPEISLAPGELLDIFTGWEVLHHEEGLEPSKKGGSLAGIIARRPASTC